MANSEGVVGHNGGQREWPERTILATRSDFPATRPSVTSLHNTMPRYVFVIVAG